MSLSQILPEQVLDRDGESNLTGVTWHLHVRDRAPLDLVALVPMLLRQINRGEVVRWRHWCMCPAEGRPGLFGGPPTGFERMQWILDLTNDLYTFDSQHLTSRPNLRAAMRSGGKWSPRGERTKEWMTISASTGSLASTSFSRRRPSQAVALKARLWRRRPSSSSVLSFR